MQEPKNRSGRTELAYAKVNLCLAVTGVRDDGYHLLDMVNVEIGLCDRLEFSWSPDPGVHVECADDSVPDGDENLIVRAANGYFQEARLVDEGLHVKLQKAIPSGGGLGGGSMDAAAVLRYLDKNYCAIPEDRLVSLAARIGADVPFGLRGGAARVRGIGEELEALRAPVDTDHDESTAPWLVLVQPAIHSDTSAAYAAWDTAHGGGDSASDRPTDTIAALVRDGDWSALPAILFNDLQEPVFDRLPELRRIHGMACETFEAPTHMSGSGSNLFCLAPNHEDARRLTAKWIEHAPDCTAVAYPILA